MPQEVTLSTSVDATGEQVEPTSGEGWVRDRDMKTGPWGDSEAMCLRMEFRKPQEKKGGGRNREQTGEQGKASEVSDES
jgi:hypothetical protein